MLEPTCGAPDDACPIETSPPSVRAVVDITGSRVYVETDDGCTVSELSLAEAEHHALELLRAVTIGQAMRREMMSRPVLLAIHLDGLP